MDIDIISKWSDHYGERLYKLILNSTVYQLTESDMRELKEKIEEALPSQ